jgi:hypothetical protein
MTNQFMREHDPDKDDHVENDSDLRLAYAAAQRERRRQGVVSSPEPEAIAAAISGALPHAERRRILEQTLSSGAGDDLALLHSVSVGEHRTERHGTGARTRAASLWHRWRLPAAAAAVLVVAVTVPVLRRSSATDKAVGTGEPVFRSGAGANEVVVLPTAAGIRPSSLVARWRAVPSAIRYDVELLDDAGNVVVQFETRDTVLSVGTLAGTREFPSATGWLIVATLPDGTVRRSTLQLFGPIPPAR